MCVCPVYSRAVCEFVCTGQLHYRPSIVMVFPLLNPVDYNWQNNVRHTQIQCLIKKRKCHCATYIPTSNSQILIRELLKCNRLGSKISINYPLIGVIQDDGAGHRDAELVVVEVLVDIIQVRDVGPESSAALEHCTDHQCNPPQQRKGGDVSDQSNQSPMGFRQRRTY